MTKTPPASVFIPFDQEEADFIASIENGEWESLPAEESKKIKKILQTAAQKKFLKSKPISIRLKQNTLLRLKNKASEIGIPYQTLLSALAEQYTQGKISLKV